MGIFLSFLLIVADAYGVYRAQMHTRVQLDAFENALRAMEAISAERGPTNGLLGGRDGNPQQLRQGRARSDERLAALAAALAGCRPCAPMPYEVESLSIALDRARVQVDHLLAQPLERRAPAARSAAVQAMIDSTERVLPLIDWLSRDMVRRTPQIGATLYNTYWTAQLREAAGLLGSQLTAALAERRRLGAEEAERLQLTQGRIGQLQMQLGLGVGHLPRHFRDDALRDLKDAYTGMQHDYLQHGLDYQRGVVQALGSERAPSPAGFAREYVPTMTSIVTLRDTALRVTTLELQRTTHQAKVRLWLIAGSALAVLLLLGAGLLWLKRQVLDPLLLGTRKMMALVHPHAEPTPDPPGDRHSVFDTLQELERQLQQAHAVRSERDALIAELKTHAQTDHLTGLPNRRAFDQPLVAPARANAHLLAVILFDVDHFKQINDAHGHPVGDRLLQSLAVRCQGQLRDGEQIARIGGEEFAIRVWLSSREAALQVAERLRRSISDSPFDLGLEQPIRITASFGIALAGPEQSDQAEALVARADEALYRAKRNGRNRCELER